MINPTDNLNPYDFEDILDFGRHRASDAINLQYYLNNDFSLQAVWVPFFQPANLPVGIFAGSLNASMEMPPGMILAGYSDTILMPRYNLNTWNTFVPVDLMDSIILEADPYLKFVLGADYNFGDGSYLNIQYIHGFIHERGADALNDYFFLRFDKKFFNGKLTISPLSGAFIVADWGDIAENYALAYMPELSYQASPNATLSFAPVFFEGKGRNLFTSMKDYDMFIFKLKYSF